MFRDDASSLHSDEKQKDAVSFTQEEHLPFFSARLAGLTRSTRTSIQSQLLLKGIKGSRMWLRALRGSRRTGILITFEVHVFSIPGSVM
jgi:hypothetical protein